MKPDTRLPWLVALLFAACTTPVDTADSAPPRPDAGGDDAMGPPDGSPPPVDSGDAPDAGPIAPPPTGCPAPDAPVADPYPFYPALDLARVPFHVSDGPWGPRRPIEAPALPTTTRRISVSTAAELEREGLVPGSEITVTADIAETVVLLGDVVDLDLIIPPDVTLSNIYVGRATPPSRSRRVRIRGPEPGRHSGGQLGSVVWFSDFADAILDGVDLNGAQADGHGLGWYIAADPAARFAIVNVRAHTLGSTALQSHATDLVIAGNNLLAGAGSRESNGFLDAWNLRGGKRMVVFDNRVEGNRYHRVRVHPNGEADEYAWIADNVFVDRNEARIFWAEDLGDHAPWNGFWALCNAIYAHSAPSAGCLSHSVDANASSYTRVTNNRYFGTVTEEEQARREIGDADYTSDSTFAPWQEPPSWGAPGDPRDVPLPGPPTPGAQDPACPGPS